MDFPDELGPSAEHVTCRAAQAPVQGSIRPPGSKSITNRALACAALASGPSKLNGALASEDTRVMIDGLTSLGAPVEEADGGATLRVDGCGGALDRAFASRADIFVGNSGATIRFITPLIVAACAGRDIEIRLDGVPRMRERPIGDLVDALRQQGAAIAYEKNDGYPPITIRRGGLRGGDCSVRGETSSQFLSGLLMAAPYARDSLRLHLTSTLVSQPYVTMTLAVMRAFGATAERLSADATPGGFGGYSIDHAARYQGRQYAIEPDASAASYFWAAAAVTGGTVTVEGLSRDALQGDVAFCECLARMGCLVEYDAAAPAITVRGGRLRGITADMGDISDTAQTLASVALFAEGPTTIRNIAHVRHKESDRIGDLARELRKLGAAVEEFEDGLTLTPLPSAFAYQPATLKTYRDHRMAMSFAVAGLRIDGLKILDPACTAKTYPGFWQDWAKLTSLDREK